MFELKKCRQWHFRETSWQFLSQPSPLIFLPKEPVQLFHFSIIIIQQMTLKNFSIKQSFIKQTHLITWFAAVLVICRTKGD